VRLTVLGGGSLRDLVALRVRGQST